MIWTLLTFGTKVDWITSTTCEEIARFLAFYTFLHTYWKKWILLWLILVISGEGSMKEQQVFRPLLDFERQIDDAFNRYNLKIKKRRQELKKNLELKKMLILKGFSRSLGK